MARANSLMGLGMPPMQAASLGFIGDEATGLSGAGTSNTDATVLTTGVNQFSTVNAGTGAVLPSQGGLVAVINNGANALLVYPGTGMQINNATVTTGSYSVANGKTAMFVHAGGRWIATLST